MLIEELVGERTIPLPASAVNKMGRRVQWMIRRFDWKQAMFALAVILQMARVGDLEIPSEKTSKSKCSIALKKGKEDATVGTTLTKRPDEEMDGYSLLPFYVGLVRFLLRDRTCS